MSSKRPSLTVWLALDIYDEADGGASPLWRDEERDSHDGIPEMW